MPKLSQKVMVDLVAELSGLTKKECKTVMEDYVTVIQESLKAGFDVNVPQLGVFSLKYKPPKEGLLLTNIATGERELTSPKDEYNAPSFSFSRLFRQEIRELTDGNVIVGKRGANNGGDKNGENE